MSVRYSAADRSSVMRLRNPTKSRIVAPTTIRGRRKNWTATAGAALTGLRGFASRSTSLSMEMDGVRDSGFGFRDGHFSEKLFTRGNPLQPGNLLHYGISTAVKYAAA